MLFEVRPVVASLASIMMNGERTAQGLRRIVPGHLYRCAKVASWVELGLFAGLLFVWLMPGFEHETFLLGLAHGLGFIALALLVLATVLRHEAPYTLLAATLTPVGPVGSVIAIHYIERTRAEAFSPPGVGSSR